MITFGMIFWMFFQPGSLTFVGIRVAIAFISIILVFFSITWKEKGKWKSTALILLIILGLGSLGYLAFNYGLLNYPRATLFTILILGIVIMMYIKYIEPKIFKKPLKKMDFKKDHPERKEDEVYITNTDGEDYHEIGWKTKRPGLIAYDTSGNKFGEYPKVFPVFVKINEIKQSQDGEEILKRLLPC